jgi:hypothetical protein
MAEENLVSSYLHITSCNNDKLESNIVEIRNAVKDNAAITKDTLMKTFLTKIIDQNFHATRLRLIQRKSGENSPLPLDSKEVGSGENSIDLSSLDLKEVGSGSYGSEWMDIIQHRKEWNDIILQRKGKKIVWSLVFKEIFTADADHDEEIKALKGIVLYMITN